MIAGIASGESTTGSATINPFGSATVSDATTNAADSATITLDVNNAPSDANGALSGAGLTETSPGVYTLAATSPAALTAELQSLVFTPVAGTAATSTSIALDVANQAGLQATATTNLSDTPATAPSNPGTTAAPMIAGIASGESTTGSATINPFGSATVSDATTNAADSATITLDVNNAPSDANGALSGAGLTETSPGVYTLAATSPAALTAELQSLVFTPVAGAAATSTSIALDVANQAGLQATATTNLSDTPATAPSNPGTTAAPMIAGIASGESTTGSATINPFGSATVSDATTNAADSATITLDVNNAPSDANGALSGAGLTETSPGVYTLAATSPAALTAELQSLVFTPVAGTAATSTSIALDVANQAGLQATATTNLSDTPATAPSNPGTTAAPMIAGIASGESTTGSATINPFGSATVSDATTNAADSATITLDVNNAPSDANGALSGAGLTETSPGVYTLAATSPAALTAELQSLVFTPVAGAAATSTSIALDVANQAGLQATATTNLSDTPASPSSSSAGTATPMISGLPKSESYSGTATISPFASTMVTDATINAADSATITLDVNNAPSDAAGSLSGSGLVETSTGVYTLTATSPAALTAELQALVLSPAPGVASGSISISVRIDNQESLTATAATDFSYTGAGTGTGTSTGTMTTYAAAPLISGQSSSQYVVGTASTHPFGSVNVIDTSTNASESATIVLLNSSNEISDASGQLTGSGLIETSAGLYRLVAATPQALTAELQALTFTPLEDTTTRVVLGVVNQAGDQASTGTELTYSNASAAGTSTPVISGLAASENAVNLNPTTPFGAVTVSDTSAGASDSAIIQLRLSSDDTTANDGFVNSDAAGTLSGAGLVHTGAGLYALNATSPAVLTAELQALVFTPAAQDSFGLVLQVSNSASLSTVGATGLNYSSQSTSGADNAVVLSGLPATQNDSIGVVTHPFGSVNLTDGSSGASDKVIIRTFNGVTISDAPGTLSGLGLSHIGTGLYELDYGSPGIISAELQDITFTPTADGNLTFLLDAVDKTGGEAVSITRLNVGAASSAGPVIDGLPDSESNSGNTSTHPFGSATVADASPGASESVTIVTYANNAPSDDNGSLSGTGLTQTAAGTYKLAATSPTALTAELQALIFTPAGGDSATPLSLLVTNQNGQVATAVTSFNNSSQQASGSSPVISALRSTETAPGGTTVSPFGQIAVFDAGANGSITATVTTLVGNLASDANGTLALYGSSLSKTGTGTYTLTAKTPAALATQLAELAFTPTTINASTTNFSVTVTDANRQSATSGTTLNYTQGSGTAGPGHIFYWLSPSSFSVSTPSNYIVNGQLASNAPTMGDVVDFATGSTTPYTVGSEGAAGSVVVRGDSVTMTGVLTTSTASLQATGADTFPGATAGLRVVADGLLTLSTNASVTGTDSVVIGGAFTTGGLTTGGLVVHGTLSEGSGSVGNDGIGQVSVSGSGANWTTSGMVSVGGGDVGLVALSNGGSLHAADVMLAQNGSLSLDETASVAGTLALAGGTLDGVAANSQAGTVVVHNAVTLQSGSESLVEGTGATTRLTGAISGAGTLAVTGQVQLATTANTASVSVLANGATLAIDTPNAQGMSGIQTNAGSTNTISLYDGVLPVNTTYVTSSGDDTIAAGSGSSLIAASTAANASGNSLKVTGGSGQITVVGGSGNTVVLGTTGTIEAYAGSAGGYVQGGSDGGNVLIATGGLTTLVGGGSGDILFAAGSGSDQLFASGANQTLVGGGGFSELIGQANNVLYGGGTGQAVLFGGATDTLVGGVGSSVLVTSDGDDAYGGPGNATIYGGNGSSVIYGSSGNASDVLVAGPGADTLYAGSGNDTLYGGVNGSTLSGNATGSTLMIGHGGSNTFIGNAGTETVYGGTGNDTFETGSGSMLAIQGGGNDTTLFGSGLATVFGGTGMNAYDFVKGVSGGVDVISGFKVGQDQIALFGYGSGTSGVASQNSAGGATNVLLTDGTRITLLGVSSLSANSIV